MGLVYVDGAKACECLAKVIPFIEKDLVAAGKIQKDLSGLILQGAYSDGSASAGTHTGGGVWDLSIYDDATLKIMRHWAFWASHRTPAQGFQDHNHAVLIGCPHLSYAAQQQVASFKAGKNGLASGGADVNLGEPFRSFTEAIAANTAPAKPTVSLARLLAARTHDLAAAQGSTYSYADVFPVEQALMKEGLLSSSYSADGYWGTLTTSAYKAWQTRLGYTGTAADGVPGKTSLTKLGSKWGFNVVD